MTSALGRILESKLRRPGGYVPPALRGHQGQDGPSSRDESLLALTVVDDSFPRNCGKGESYLEKPRRRLLTPIPALLLAPPSVLVINGIQSESVEASKLVNMDTWIYYK